ncbi:MAG: BlaI/MecI/CopY family transcriptional regulator [Clostridia bacterium]|nr:BlaI/MecI/CopY family transcriptional regulator [Clostridia bacterium]
MKDVKLGAVEARFADLIWKHAPLSSGELVKLCETELTWKKSTTYTVLKKLCERGLFENQNGTVVTRIEREEFYALQSEQFVEETFDGSLPAFLAAFTQRKKLSPKEIEEIRRMIDAYKED